MPVLLVGIGAIVAQYFAFVSQSIYTESISHLTEIFHRAFTSLNTLVNQKRTDPHMRASYLQDVSAEEQIQSFPTRQQAESGFTDFYFISAGALHRADAQTGKEKPFAPKNQRFVANC